MEDARKRKTLALTCAVLTITGLLLASIPFLTLLQPNQVALNNFRKEVDVSNLVPGQHIETQWFSSTVFILRRTREQIEFLKTYQPPKLRGFLGDIQSEFRLMDNQLRSNDPEYFVFLTWKDRGNYWFRETSSYYSCQEFVYSSALLMRKNGRRLQGSLHCLKAWGQAIDPSESYMFYDLAGRSVADWVAPLYVPVYSITANKRVVLGPPN